MNTESAPGSCSPFDVGGITRGLRRHQAARETAGQSLAHAVLEALIETEVGPAHIRRSSGTGPGRAGLREAGAG
jgi:hypothetical protein